MDTKICPKCKTEKTLNEFAKSKIHRYGVDSWCKNCRAQKQREYTKLGIGSRNKDYIKQKRISDKQKWLNYLNHKNPSPKCEVCGKELKYFDGKDGIHFDHRENGNESIQHHPSSWMGRHPLNKNNIEKFESCNFGILCIRCNRILPTIGRQSFMRRLIKYVFKKDIIL